MPLVPHLNTQPFSLSPTLTLLSYPSPLTFSPHNHNSPLQSFTSCPQPSPLVPHPHPISLTLTPYPSLSPRILTLTHSLASHSHTSLTSTTLTFTPCCQPSPHHPESSPSPLILSPHHLPSFSTLVLPPAPCVLTYTRSVCVAYQGSIYGQAALIN